jgi:hypothetical protein
MPQCLMNNNVYKKIQHNEQSVWDVLKTPLYTDEDYDLLNETPWSLVHWYQHFGGSSTYLPSYLAPPRKQ